MMRKVCQLIDREASSAIFLETNAHTCRVLNVGGSSS